MVLPRVWDLVEKFKEFCRTKGWNVHEDDDLIEAGNEYHKFVWVHRLHPNTFKSVVLNPLCRVREGGSDRIVRVSYVGWILPETPSLSIWQLVREAPNLSRTVALYDLSWAYKEKPVCLTLNETDSVVLREFERFLNAEYGIRLSSLTSSPQLLAQYAK